jgi:hypothetical protein
MNIITPIMSPNVILERLKTVDGAGSGLDADTLDTYHASSFVLGSTISPTYRVSKTYLDVAGYFDISPNFYNLGFLGKSVLRWKIVITTGFVNTSYDNYIYIEHGGEIVCRVNYAGASDVCYYSGELIIDVVNPTKIIGGFTVGTAASAGAVEFYTQLTASTATL